MSTYILQKDLPDGAKKGDAYTKGGDRYRNKRFQDENCPVIEDAVWFSWQVENNPEWFKPVPAVDIHITADPDCKVFSVTTSDGRWITFNIDAKYTEEDMRDCFEQSRLTNPMVGFKHDTFEDYLKTIK